MGAFNLAVTNSSRITPGTTRQAFLAQFKVHWQSLRAHGKDISLHCASIFSWPQIFIPDRVMFYILQQYPCIAPLLSLSLPQNRKSDSLLSQLPDTRCRYPKLGTGKCTVTPMTRSKAQFQVSHPARLPPFLNHIKLWEETREKGWSANFQIKLAMLFLKIPRHLDERLKETDTEQLQPGGRRSGTDLKGSWALLGAKWLILQQQEGGNCWQQRDTPLQKLVK